VVRIVLGVVRVILGNPTDAEESIEEGFGACVERARMNSIKICLFSDHPNTIKRVAVIKTCAGREWQDVYDPETGGVR